MNTRLESFGIYLPRTMVTSKELMQRMPGGACFNLEKVTGIKSRRFRSEAENSLYMAVQAALNCLEDSCYTADDLDIIINASITRYTNSSCFLYEPSLSLLIKNELKARRAIHFDITNACAGMLTGIYILDGMLKSGSIKRGMVVSGESITPIAESALLEVRDLKDEQVAALTVGDSAAAVILDRDEADGGINFIEFNTFADLAELCIGMPNKRGDGPAMYAKSSVLNNAMNVTFFQYIADTCEKYKTAFTREYYDYVIFHQISARWLTETVKNAHHFMGCDIPQSVVCVDQYGNSSTTSHFLALYELARHNKLSRGTRLLLVSSASGVNIGIMSLTLTQGLN